MGKLCLFMDDSSGFSSFSLWMSLTQPMISNNTFSAPVIPFVVGVVTDADKVTGTLSASV